MKMLAQFFGMSSAINPVVQKAMTKSLGICEINAVSGKITAVNSRLCDFLGCGESELIGASLADYCIDLTLAKTVSTYSSGQQFRVDASAIMNCKDRGGKITWLNLHFILEDVSGDGKSTIVVLVKDETERHENDERNRLNSGYANALEQCQANVMLADNELNIIYMNKNVKTMLKSRENELRKSLPNFRLEGLIGQSVDAFHKNPNHQRNLLKNLHEPYKTELKIDEMIFGLIATPWLDADGKRLGTLVEWEDKTAARALEKSLSTIAEENLRIRQALDVCDTSVMLADENLKIIYLNKAVQKMLQDRQKEIVQVIPRFDAKNLMGVCVDDFHKSPSHQRNLLGNLKDTYKTDLKLNGLTFNLMATPLFDGSGKRIGTVVEWKDRTIELAEKAKEQVLIEENARVRQALDTVTANVMIADIDANIIYMNNAVESMMKMAEQDLRKELSDFNASQLMGKNMDIFHKNPSHQRNLMNNLRGTYRGKAEVAGRHFTVIATPIMANGNRLGTVVEWADKTAEVNIEREIDKVLEAAMAGDFTRQVSMDGKVGFFADLSKGLNTLVSTVEVSLNDVLRMLGAMAKGDLSERITRDYQGSFGQLKNDANATVEKLTEVIGRIRTSSETIGTAANEIAQGNADLSQRTEEQASSLEETASSMEQMTSAVRQSAGNAQEAHKFSDEAREKARTGGEVVASAIKAMDDINVASKKISDIIGVIDEIAFQTNLLALNAAVEAARAGEQGRGFAVVAGEVRNLAQRSAGAAKEIKDLIRDSVGKVQDGQALVNASGETLSEIVTSVEKVSTMVRDIANAAMEQTSGIEQVNTAISQMDEMTQQNAALVEEASAAGQAMADQARDMSSVVEFFSIGSHLQSMGEGRLARQKSPATRPASKISAATHKPNSKPVSKPKRPAAADDEWEEF